MHRIPPWALITVGALLAALSISGLLFSVHTSARIVYATLLVVGVAGITNGYQRRRT